jgi:hypothetical protein
MFKKAILWPGLHFLLIGSIMFMVDVELRLAVANSWHDPVVITEAWLDRARVQHGERPLSLQTDEERRNFVQSVIDEELLFREALRMELDRTDPAVLNRLEQITDFVELEGEKQQASAADRLLQARRLGLHRDDPVIRRHLISLVRVLYRSSLKSEETTEQQVRSYYTQHRESFMAPARIKIVQVYFSPDKRGAAAIEDAFAARRTVTEADPGLESVERLGDPLRIGVVGPPLSARELAGDYGFEFATKVMKLPEGQWSEPLLSPYGVHLVYVERKISGVPIPFEQARMKAYRGLLRELEDQRLRDKLTELKIAYKVRIVAGTAAGGVDE